MVQGLSTQRSWAAGEVSTRLRLAEDLDIIRQGAPKLENVIVIPQGGIAPLPGSFFFKSYDEPAISVSFIFSASITYDLVFYNTAIDIFSDGELLLTLTDQQWQTIHLPKIRTAQVNDELYVVCGVLPPKKIVREGDLDWVVKDFSWFVNSDRDDREEYPYVKFADGAISLDPSVTSGSGTITARDVTGGALTDIFTDDWVGVHIRIKDRELEITSVPASPGSVANITVIETLKDSKETSDWEERAFSDLRGWPAEIDLFQTRLTLVPDGRKNTLFHSRSDDYFNFMRKEKDDEVLDTHGIVQSISGKTYNEIIDLESRDLQQLVLTTGGLYSVEQASTASGFSPDNHQQRRLWSVGGKAQTLVVASGSGLYCPVDGSALYENAFDARAQKVVTKDLSIPSEQLFQDPIVQVVSAETPYRALLMRTQSGALRILTYTPEQGVFAFVRVNFGDWLVEHVSVLSTNLGHLARFILKKDDLRIFVGMPPLNSKTLSLHAAIEGTSEAGANTWAGLDHFEGETVSARVDGAKLYEGLVVSGGQIMLPETTTANSIQIGFKIIPDMNFYMPPEENKSFFPRRMQINNVGLWFKEAEIRRFLVALDGHTLEPVDTIESDDWTMGNYENGRKATHMCQVRIEEPAYWELIGFCYDLEQNGY